MTQEPTRPTPVDFDSVRKNAAEQEVNLSEIAIFYEGLSPDQVTLMREKGVVAQESGASPIGASVIGRFCADGSVLFPEFASGVHYLGA